MQLQDFDYDLPNELIAKYPLQNRSASKMLHFFMPKQLVKHKNVVDLVDILKPNDVLVFNNTKVIPARLYGEKTTGGKVEILIDKIISSKMARVMLKSNRSIQQEQQLVISDNKLIVREKSQGLFIIEVISDIDLYELLEQYGHIPIPHYLGRTDEKLDFDRYQTVYACEPGAIAAPTAGLHFDEQLLSKLKDKGIGLEYLTLHVGLGTFAPVKTDNITEHTIHKEYLELSEDTCDRLNSAKQQGKRIISVGTTVTRALETAYKNELTPFHGETDIFIYPGYKFKFIDCLLTNFHLPKSTLLMLVSAFAGRENILSIYREAIENKYRFYSYGDLMYLERG